MSIFRSLSKSRKEKTRERSQSRNRSENLPGIQQYSYYPDLAIRSGHCTISSELVSLRHSRLERSLDNLVYTPNDELNYFILYMESCSLSSFLKFILDIQVYENLTRHKTHRNDLQSNALSLFHRYLSIDATYPLSISDELRRTTLSLICPPNNSDIPDTDCFRMVRDFVWQFIKENAYPAYLTSAYHVNYQLKLLTSDHLQLHDLLFHHHSLSYLCEFAAQEKFLDMIHFFLASENFYQSTINRMNDAETLTKTAIDIYERYISLQAPAYLGVDDAIRARIECSICQPDIDAGPSDDTFDQVAWMIYMILQREYFAQFLQSAIFYRYISDLMVKLRNDDAILSSRPVKDLDADQNSIHSDTAVPSTSSPPVNHSVPSTRQRNPSVSSSSSSVNQELNNRPRGKFSMGYVDSLGRFIRDPDVNPTETNRRNPSNNPIQFLSSLIRQDQDDLAVEEAAARFAETFINEITTMTANLDNE